MGSGVILKESTSTGFSFYLSQVCSCSLKVFDIIIFITLMSRSPGVQNGLGKMSFPSIPLGPTPGRKLGADYQA